MSVLQLALKNIRGNLLRSIVVFLCALFLSGAALAMTLIVQGAEQSLTQANRRLGADIIVVPVKEKARAESALLMGEPTQARMSRDIVDKLARISGVESVSPQLYIGTLASAPASEAPPVYLMAFDPQTDFAIMPWFEKQLGRPLKLKEAVGGASVVTPEGKSTIELPGSAVTLVANLAPTGTALDQTLFVSFETAYELARDSGALCRVAFPCLKEGEEGLDVPPGSISAALVRLRPGSAAPAVSSSILQEIPEVIPIDSPDMFQTYRRQILGLVAMMAVVLLIALVLSVVLIDLVFSMAVNERRREIAVLRALGATHRAVLLWLLTEANLLASAGGAIGLGVTAIAFYSFKADLSSRLNIPLVLPPVQQLLLLVLSGLLFALISINVSALIPAYKISRQEAALAMKE